MALLWASGGGLQSVTGDVEFSTVTGTVSVQSAVKRVGPYAIRTNPTNGNSFVRYHWAATDVTGVLYLAAYLRIASAPTGNVTISRIANASNDPAAQVRLTPSRTLVLLDAAGDPVGSESAALALDTWYLLEYGVDASTAPGTVTARLDGAEWASGANSAQVPWSRWLYGPVASTTCDLYWADLRAHDNTGTANNSWPGEGVVTTVFPTGPGDANQWSNTSNGAGSTSNWNLVDDAPPDDATTLVQTGSATAEDMYTVGSSGVSAGDTVHAVMVGARFRNNTADATAAFKVQVKKTSGGTVVQSAAIVPNATAWRTNAPAQPRNYPINLDTDPDGSAWTASTVGSMQIGVKATAAGTNRVQVTTVWAVVVYTPGSGGTTVEGAASADLGGVTATATGVRTVHGTASASFSSAATATGQRTVQGTAAAEAGFAASAVGAASGGTVTGQASTAAVFTATATGQRTVVGSASAVLGGFEATAAGDRTVTGTANAATAVEATAAGTRTVAGTASAAITAAGTVAAVRTVQGTAQADVGQFVATAAGTRTVSGAAATNLTADATATGERTVTGAAAVDIAFTADVQVAPTTHGAASADLGGIAATAAGVRTVHGRASAAIGLAADAAGVRTVQGTAETHSGLTATASGTRTVQGSAETSVGFAADVSVAPVEHGTATVDLGGVTATATGVRTVHGVASAAFGATATATGRRTVTGTATALAGVAATVEGQRTVHGSATAHATLEATAAGHRTIHGTAHAAVTFAAVATAPGAPAGDVTITTGPLARGWTTGEPARAWTAGAPTT